MNAGGVIQVEDERHGFSFARAQAKASGIFDVALRVFQAADDEGVSPAVAADRLAEERIAARSAGWRPSGCRAEQLARAGPPSPPSGGGTCARRGSVS